MNEQFKSTLEKYENFLKVKNYSNSTIIVYKQCVLLFLKKHFNKTPTDLSQKDLEDFIFDFKFSSISQQNQYYSSLKLFYKNILNSKLSKVNLERPRREKHLPQIIDQENIKDKISLIKNLKHKTIISLAYSTGMRVSEICNLKISNIDSKRFLIKIENGKGRKDRYVPLSQNILNLLREYYKVYKPKDFLFNGQNSLKYSIKSCQQIYKKYIDNSTSFHTLRHSCFTHLLENNTDCRVIQKIAGHANIKTTEGYMHVSNNLLKKVILLI